MTSTASVLRRDRRVVALALFAVVVLAWVYLVVMVGFGVETVAGTHTAAWTAAEFALMSIMWAVMMVAMMLPSASPMILMFARINRDNRGRNEPFVPTGLFVAGYVVIWLAFSLAATAMQGGLHRIGLLSPTMASTDGAFGGAVLVAAGLYQWSSLKHVCLRHCQTPLGFLMTRWRDGAGGAFRMGLSHGAYCVGCCWVLMALLFVGGVMNPLWVAALAAFVFVEKIAAPGFRLPRIAGAALIVWGGWVLGSALWELSEMTT